MPDPHPTPGRFGSRGRGVPRPYLHSYGTRPIKPDDSAPDSSHRERTVLFVANTGGLAIKLIELSPEDELRRRCQGPSGSPVRFECLTHKRESSDASRANALGKSEVSSAPANGGSRNTMSHVWARSAASFTNLCASRPQMREFCAPKASRPAASAVRARLSRSTKSTNSAPRERLSTPKAPEPAQRSRHLAPSIELPIHANAVSRRRLGVGLRPEITGKRSFRRFHLPPIMRTCPVRAAMRFTPNQIDMSMLPQFAFLRRATRARPKCRVMTFPLSARRFCA